MCVSVACADKCVLGPHCSKDLLVCFPFSVSFKVHISTHHKVKTDDTNAPCHVPQTPSGPDLTPLGCPDQGFLS